MGDRSGGRQRKYRRFVESALAQEDTGFVQMVRGSGWAIGGEKFCGWVRNRCSELARKAAKPEDVACRQAMQTLGSEAVLAVVGRHLGVTAEALRQRRRNSVARPVAARMLAKYAGLTNRAIAGVLGTTSGVSAGMQVRRAIEAAEGDKKVARLMAAIEDELRKMSDGKRDRLS
jgi:hypothetical protein